MQAVCHGNQAMCSRCDSRDETHVEPYERTHEAQISPMARIVYVEPLREERIRRRVGAVSAAARRVRVREVAARCVDERTHVLRARLSRRRVDSDKFVRGAADRLFADDWSRPV